MAACYDVWQAALGADDPDGAPWGRRLFGAWLKNGWEGTPSELWIVPGSSGSSGADAWCRVGLPDRENLTVAEVELVVHPRARRRGLGGELLRHTADRALARGRTLLAGVVRENSAGLAFAERVKATRGLTDVRRVLDLSAAGTAPGNPGPPAELAGGYSIVRWRDATPPEYAARVAAVYEAMNDAPRDAGREGAAWDADRVAHDDAVAAEFGGRLYQVAVRHDATGDFAGLTGLFVDPEHPDWARVTITAVTRPHRGHRLGLAVKAAAQEWAASQEPALRWIETDNASGNRHMIAVNEALGYQIADPALVSFELPVAQS